MGVLNRFYYESNAWFLYLISVCFRDENDYFLIYIHMGDELYFSDWFRIRDNRMGFYFNASLYVCSLIGYNIIFYWILLTLLLSNSPFRLIWLENFRNLHHWGGSCPLIFIGLLIGLYNFMVVFWLVVTWVSPRLYLWTI